MTQNDNIQQANEETRRAWDANASFWDQKMGEGNDFANQLCWPSILHLLDPQPGQRILDIATGNGLTARRLAALGAKVWASDFSSELIRIAQSRPNPSDLIQYKIVDATDESALLGAFASSAPFDSALCNMALFDMADIEPLFRTLPKLLKPGGFFVFTLTHPAFNNASCVHVVEERDDDGQIKIVYSVKVSQYITPFQSRGIAIRGQPQAQIYFDRPLQTYFNLGFQNGFVLDGFEERAFPPDHPQGSPLGWGGKFSEIPPVLAARMRLFR
jgi:2-polyprenyl-3-methyl-5-hydroxy-6-metoxy-1,4-benzoquinol methylase